MPRRRSGPGCRTDHRNCCCLGCPGRTRGGGGPAIKRLGDRYQWQEIDEPEYRTERAKLQAQLAELPPPMDSNVLAFDRIGEQLLPIAKSIRETTSEHQAALIKHAVERVTVTDGEVTGIALRAEARP